MAQFTISQPGSMEDAMELRRRVSEVGIEIGYGARRGPNRGHGALGLMLRDLADGRAVLLPAEDADDIAWLAGVLESLIADNPKRLESVEDGYCVVCDRAQTGGAGAGGRRAGRWAV